MGLLWILIQIRINRLAEIFKSRLHYNCLLPPLLCEISVLPIASQLLVLFQVALRNWEGFTCVRSMFCK